MWVVLAQPVPEDRQHGRAGLRHRARGGLPACRLEHGGQGRTRSLLHRPAPVHSPEWAGARAAGVLPASGGGRLAMALGLRAAAQRLQARPDPRLRARRPQPGLPLARGTAPLLVALVGAGLLGEMMDPSKVLAVLLIALGVVLLSLKGGTDLGAIPAKALA